MEIAGISKRATDQDHAETTLIDDNSKQLLLQTTITIDTTLVTRTISTTTPNLADALTTTLVVKGLPL